MFSNPLVARWDIIATTQQALRYGGASLRNVPGLLKRVLSEKLWCEYVVPSGEVMRFATFQNFANSTWGLDTTLDMLERICAEDLAALDLLDQAATHLPGNKNGINQYTVKDPEVDTQDGQPSLLPADETICGTTDIVSSSTKRAYLHGNARTYALRRLRKERQDLHARVLAGELSPHQGMIEAGFRHGPTPLDYLHRYWRKVSPDDRLRFLLEMLTPQERRVVQQGLFPDEESTP